MWLPLLSLNQPFYAVLSCWFIKKFILSCIYTCTCTYMYFYFLLYTVMYFSFCYMYLCTQNVLHMYRWVRCSTGPRSRVRRRALDWPSSPCTSTTSHNGLCRVVYCTLCVYGSMQKNRLWTHSESSVNSLWRACKPLQRAHGPFQSTDSCEPQPLRHMNFQIFVNWFANHFREVGHTVPCLRTNCMYLFWIEVASSG